MIVKAFQPLVFRNDIKGVTSPPFDVITKEQEKVLKENEYNITHLTLPELGGPGKSRDLLHEWHRQGIIAKETESCLIVITQDFRGNGKDFNRIGLIALVETSPPAGIVMPHEDTFDWAVKDRRHLMEATGCQLEPIFLAVNGISFERMLRAAIRELEPFRKFEEPTGVRNSCYLVRGEHSIDSIIKAVSKDTAVVADGHHRLKATMEIFRDSKEEDRDFWKYSFAYITSLQQESLMISGIHRIISNEFSFSKIRESIGEYFRIEDVGHNHFPGRITVYDGKYHSLVPKDNAFDELGDFGKIKFQADPGLVNQLIFNKIMGMGIEEVARKIYYTQSVPIAVEEVDKGKSGFAILMPEWEKSVFLSMVEKGRIMPQKSTYFYPKIPSGIAIYCKEFL